MWRSLESFDGRCGLRTWVYRIAHNVSASHIVRQRQVASRLVDLEALEVEPASIDEDARADHRHAAQKLLGLIHQLRPADREIVLQYLEGETAAQIADMTGLSASNIATKIHRIKKLLQQQLVEGNSHERR